MGVFYILLIFPMLLQHITVKGIYIDYQKRNNAALAFYFLLLTVMVMFRHESVGNDTRNYIRLFRRFAAMDWYEVINNDLEIGYSLLNKFISLFSEDSRFFLVITAILVNLMIYPTYKRLGIDTALTIVLFSTMSTFIMMFSGIRQMLAVGMGFLAYECTRNKRIIPFALTVLLAITIHTSAFMLAFMYPIYHARITKKWLWVVIPVLCICFVFNRSIFSVLTIFIERYTKYEGGISSTGAYTMLFLFAAFTLFSFVIPDENRIDKETIGLRNFLLFSLILQMFAPLHSLAMRMNYYYIIFIPLLIPKIIECRSKRWNQVAMAARHIMVFFFLLYFFANAFRGGSLNVFPYHFFWENV